MRLESDRDATSWIWGAKALAVVAAYNALGLFERLQAGPVRRSELGVDERAAATTIPVLLHVGLVATDGELLRLTHAGARLLERGELPSERNLDMLRDLSQMKEVIQSGGPVRDEQGKPKATRGGTRADDMAHTERFLDYLYQMSEGAARTTLEWLSPLLAQHARVLDVGGGHGRYARAFAYAGHPTTLFDFPHVIELAKKRHGEALSYIAGDFHEPVSFGGPYDLILLCNIVHSESAEANASLVSRLARVLLPGGHLVIKDMFLDEVGAEPANAVFFGLTMLCYTEHGQSPSLDRAKQWLTDAGLSKPRVTLLDTQALVVAQKPA